MPRDDSQFFGRELAQIKKAVADLKSGRLQNASMHGSRIYVYDDEGDVREVIGNQGDGSYGSRVILSPPQPTPTAPILPASDGDERVATVFAVRWDGGIVQGVVPVVHGRVDVWTQKLTPGEEPDPSAAVLSGSIRDQQGGVTDVVVQGAGTYAVWLQMVGADRVTKGEFSQPAVVDVTALVDTERLEGALQGDLPDGIYNSLMARLAEFLYVRADQIDVNSLAADAARMNELWAGLAVISEAQIDDLLGDSAKFKTIEGASITGGSLRTSSASGNGVTVDEGLISYYDIFSGNTRSHVAPYVEFGTGQVEGERPKIAAGPVSGLVISAGNSLNGQGSSLNPIIMHGQVLTDRINLGGGARFSPQSIMLGTDGYAQIAGFRTNGFRTGISGRVMSTHDPQDMYTHARAGLGSYTRGATAERGTYTWGAPTPFGSRRVAATIENNDPSGAAWNGFRAFAVSTPGTTASHFTFVVAQVAGDGATGMNLHAIGWWD